MGFAILFAVYGIEYAVFGSIQNSPMMRANMLITHVSVPIAGALWTLFTGFRLFQAVATYRATSKDLS
jgi:TRAP-type C4-dicarboxylate transport system permease small subunit